MPRPRNTIPKFSVSSTGRAFTKVNGRFISLGRGDDPDSRRRYAEAIADQDAGNAAPVTQPKRTVTLGELMLKFTTNALPRFSKSEQHCQRTVIRLTRILFGQTPVDKFGPLKLRVLRDAMVAGDPNELDKDGKPKPRKPWSRSTVNRQVKRLRAIIRWGVSWEMVAPGVVEALDAVSSLTATETTALESKPRRSVCQSDIDAVRAKLKPLYRDVLDLLTLTGARPGELVGLTMKDINRSSEIWRADLVKHKTSHKGKSRTLFFNVTAQAILLRHFKADPDAKLFPVRRDNFGTAVKRACTKAKITPFVPHEIRHTTATKLVDHVGLEFAQRVMGHSDKAMTEHYSRTADRQAVEAVKTLG